MNGYETSRYHPNNCSLSGVYDTCMYCKRSVKIKQAQNATKCAKIVNVFVLRLLLCDWSAKPRRPRKLSPRAGNAITRGGIEGLGSLVYICGPVGSSQLYLAHIPSCIID